MTKGDRVRLTCDGCTVEAVVMLASENGRSLMLEFEAILAGHVGMMPVLGEGDPPRYRTLVGDLSVTIVSV